MADYFLLKYFFKVAILLFLQISVMLLVPSPAAARDYSWTCFLVCVCMHTHVVFHIQLLSLHTSKFYLYSCPQRFLLK